MELQPCETNVILLFSLCYYGPTKMGWARGSGGPIVQLMFIWKRLARLKIERMGLLEMRIQIEKRGRRTKVGDPGFNPRSVGIIIKLWVIIKHHAMGKALSERSDEHCRPEPQPEPPSFFLEQGVAFTAQLARRLVLIRKPCFQLISAASRHQDQRVEIAVRLTSAPRHRRRRNHSHY